MHSATDLWGLALVLTVTVLIGAWAPSASMGVKLIVRVIHRTAVAKTGHRSRLTRSLARRVAGWSRAPRRGGAKVDDRAPADE